MYNTVKLHPDDWCMQRYLWKDDLDEKNAIVEKVIKTLIYGVRYSVNQSECGLRRTADYSKDRFPEVCTIVNRDVYVDDCLSGEESYDLALERADQLELVLNQGGFTLKGITMSGVEPDDKLSADGDSISIAGLLWQSKNDTISLDIKEMNFAKKVRGKKKEKILEVPAVLTRRHCTAKVAEIFDLSGSFTPVVAAMKIDLHDLVVRKLDWDDRIPDEFRPIWIKHFETMNEMGSIRFQRAVVPSDAVSLDVDLLAFGDASKMCICVAVYARFKKTTGDYSCQLVFGRSKLVPEGLSQPCCFDKLQRNSSCSTSFLLAP